MNTFVCGQSYMTRNGTMARVICDDAQGGFPIIALVWSGGDECPQRYRPNGRAWDDNPSQYDLLPP